MNNNRREFLKTSAAAGVLAIGASSAFAAKKKPNILWIIAEDMNPWMSCYGDKLLTTPNFDGMAERGVRFSRSYVNAPVCSSCRSGLITGTYQTTLGIHNHRSSRDRAWKPEHKGLGMIHLPKGVKTIPELFQDAGYETFNQGKTDYNFVYDNKALYSVGNWKEAVDKGKPFFGQIQVKGGKNGQASLAKGEKEKLGIGPEDVTVPPYYPDCPEFRDAYADHYANVFGTDKTVGDILARLDADGLRDNTIVFFFSDHGAPPLLRHKQFCYEGGIRVPLLVDWTGDQKAIRANGAVRDDLVSTLDVSVSSLRLAGIDVPSHMHGRDLFAADHEERDYVVSARDRCDFTIERIRAVTTKRYKYLRNFLTDRPYMQPQYRDGRPEIIAWRKLQAEGKLTPEASVWVGDERPAEELYDLKNDPDEIRNLADDPKYAKELKRHRDILKKWIAETGDKGEEGESVEGLLQVMYGWGKRCVNPEYDAVRAKYGADIGPKPKQPKAKRTRKARAKSK